MKNIYKKLIKGKLTSFNLLLKRHKYIEVNQEISFKGISMQ